MFQQGSLLCQVSLRSILHPPPPCALQHLIMWQQLNRLVGVRWGKVRQIVNRGGHLLTFSRRFFQVCIIHFLSLTSLSQPYSHFSNQPPGTPPICGSLKQAKLEKCKILTTKHHPPLESSTTPHRRLISHSLARPPTHISFDQSSFNWIWFIRHPRSYHQRRRWVLNLLLYIFCALQLLGKLANFE